MVNIIDIFYAKIKKEIEKNDYNLSVSTYVEKEDTGEVIDIKVLNQEIAETVRKIDAFESFHK